jgi:pimeloyl-ACP methyl ester carboxylesterase
VVRPVAVPLAALLVLTGAGRGDLDGEGPTAAPRSREPDLEPRDCRLAPDVGATVECHWLVVPMDREKPKGDTIRLAVAVLKSQAAQPAPDPVVYLEGGPGGSIVADLDFFAESQILEERDLVVFDQRGTGLSEPALECPEREEAVVRNLGRAETYETELADYGKAFKACRARLEDEGVDLDAFDTEASAADLADLRVALEVDEWNLYGTSYGTRLALATVRSHPSGIRSAILDSVYPPGVGGLNDVDRKADRSFRALFDACTANAACAAAYPDLEGTVEAVVQQFNETPFEGTVDLGDPFGTVPLVITGDDLVAGLFLALYDTTLIPSLPSIVAGLSRGETGVIPLIAQEGIPFLNGLAEGTFVGVDCADNGSLLGDRDDELVEDPGDKAGLFVYFAESFCDAWRVEALPPAFHDPVRSRIPALVLAGTFDPATPPGQSKAAARALKNATYVQFDGHGHVVTFDNDCALALRAAFLNDPTAALDTSCADAFAPTFQPP